MTRFLMILKKYRFDIEDAFLTTALVITILYVVLLACGAVRQLIPHVNIETYSEYIDYGVLSDEQMVTFNDIIDAIENNQDTINCRAYSIKERHEIMTQLGLHFGYIGELSDLVYFSDNVARLNLNKLEQLTAQKCIIDARVDEAASTLIEGSDRYKLWQISNYITGKIVYTKGLHDTMMALNGKGVCDSYAMIFYKMATRLGIKTYICYGYAGDGYHAWNMVKLNGEYVHYDPTWYDSSFPILKYIHSKSSWDRVYQVNNKWSIDLEK